MLDSVLKSYQSPTRMVHAIGALSALGDEAAAINIKRPLVVTDQGIVKAGLLDEALKPLRAAGLDPVIYDQVRANPGIQLVDTGAAYYKKERCDGLVAIGGGSSIDSAKGIGVVAVHGGSIVAYEWGKDPIHSRIPPLVAVPTTAGTGSEVTLWAVITDPDRKIKFNVGGTPNIASWVALIDPQLSMNLPAGVTAGTGMDALTQLIEPYVSIRATPITDALCLDGMTRAVRSLRRVYSVPDDMEARTDMSLASLLSGMALANAGLGAVHGFAAAISGMFSAPHGAICAALLPPVTRTNIEALRKRQPKSESLDRYRQVARLLTGQDGAKADDGVNWVRDLCRDLNIPRLAAYGIDRTDVGRICEKASAASSMKANPIALTSEELQSTLIEAL